MQSGAFKQQFNAGNNITVIVTTFTDMKRVADMRKWTWDEVQSDPNVYGRFRFGLLDKAPEPQQFLFGNRWYNLTSDQPNALAEYEVEQRDAAPSVAAIQPAEGGDVGGCQSYQ